MTCLDDLLVSLPDDLLMMRQLHAGLQTPLLFMLQVIDNMLSSGCKAWFGKTEEIKMPILVGAIQNERTQTPKATQGL
ncbi:hypothetical protein F2Q69_00048545 [Brassica cretica]|uniref:Uncharacterized protein n=1 Tax=Brassica cretica TaxID=69181 RepID=A0A8S9PXC8_BRACR|nr:hypothetical protein F2Q69_00048545 [Brassica cretica]